MTSWVAERLIQTKFHVVFTQHVKIAVINSGRVLRALPWKSLGFLHSTFFLFISFLLFCEVMYNSYLKERGLPVGPHSRYLEGVSFAKRCYKNSHFQRESWPLTIVPSSFLGSHCSVVNIPINATFLHNRAWKDLRRVYTKKLTAKIICGKLKVALKN